jgi:hypothetical protein
MGAFEVEHPGDCATLNPTNPVTAPEAKMPSIQLKNTVLPADGGDRIIPTQYM